MPNSDIFSVITAEIANIDISLNAYKVFAKQFTFLPGGTCSAPPANIVTLNTNMADKILANQVFIDSLGYTSMKYDDIKRDVASGRANSAYKQSEQSTMLYNISVSSLVNIISGVLILIFFIGKELGLSVKKMSRVSSVAAGVKKASDRLVPKKTPKDKADSGKDKLDKTPPAKPDTSKDKPDSGKNKPDSGKNKPDTDKDKGDSGKDKGDSGKDKPDSGKDKGDSGKDKPDSGKAKPDSGKDKGDSGKDKP
jgi:hypothetical protein